MKDVQPGDEERSFGSRSGKRTFFDTDPVERPGRNRWAYDSVGSPGYGAL